LPKADRDDETRIFYLDDGNRIIELRWGKQPGKDKEEWYKGSLTVSEFEAMPDSVISAVATTSQIKVYYRGTDKNGPRLWVAFCDRDGGNWQRRSVLEF
jgi:hypothetical protein